MGKQLAQLAVEKCGVLFARRTVGESAPVKIIGQNAKAFVRERGGNAAPDKRGRGQPVHTHNNGSGFRTVPLVVRHAPRQFRETARCCLAECLSHRFARGFPNEGGHYDRKQDQCD